MLFGVDQSLYNIKDIKDEYALPFSLLYGLAEIHRTESLKHLISATLYVTMGQGFFSLSAHSL